MWGTSRTYLNQNATILYKLLIENAIYLCLIENMFLQPTDLQPTYQGILPRNSAC
jgi:hypothetical protein